MPVIVEIKTKSGTVKRIQLPVEIWMREKSWTFKSDTNEEIESIHSILIVFSPIITALIIVGPHPMACWKKMSLSLSIPELFLTKNWVLKWY